MTNAIEAAGLVKRFGKTTALAGVDLVARPAAANRACPGGPGALFPGPPPRVRSSRARAGRAAGRWRLR